MINLLPPQQKKEALEEQKYKLFLISGALIIVFLIALSLTLLAIKINISAKSQEERIVIPEQIKDKEMEIYAINKDLQDLASFYNRKPDFIKNIEKISAITPQDIKLTSISINFSGKTGVFSLTLQGFAPTRELLSQFRRNLESDASFGDINFPPSNWVKPKDIEFNINLKAEL